MKVTIDFPYESVENLIRAIDSPISDKEEFYYTICNDLNGNYFFPFSEGIFPYTSDAYEYVRSIVSEEQLENLYNIYLQNKDIIDNEVEKKFQTSYTGLSERLLNKYYGSDYIPPKNAVSIIYEGKEYKSKAQCCYLNNISIYKLNKYLKNENK